MGIKMISMKKAAELLGVSRQTVRLMVKLGQMPAYPCGNRRMLRLVDVELYPVIASQITNREVCNAKF
jgi:excisionase family DNA binding protein